MRRAALISFVASVSFAAAFAVAAAGGDRSRALDVRAANARTARAASVRYAVDVTLTKTDRPITLHIRSDSSRDRLVAKLALGTTDGAILLDKPFLYEQAPQVAQVFGDVHWLRLQTTGLSERSQVLSTLRSLTPAPLLHVIAEAKLHAVAGRTGVFAGSAAYDDPVVRTSLRKLGDGLEFRGLRLRVIVGRDGFVHAVRLTGRTPDGATTLHISARLFAFGKPVSVTPPTPGTFMDPELEQLQS